MAHPAYPFVPKSTAYMRRGQFWAVPLNSGRYACGYVVDPRGHNSRMFVAGLTDWIGSTPPTASDLSGHRVIEHAKAHLKTITENGHQILGCCDVPLSVEPGARDRTWGYSVIRTLAEKHFGAE